MRSKRHVVRKILFQLMMMDICLNIKNLCLKFKYKKKQNKILLLFVQFEVLDLIVVDKNMVHRCLK
jgi:hypothetical protein